MGLTVELLEGLVDRETYLKHGTLTICVLDLKNGAQVVGQSNCIDPARYQAEVGEKVSRQNAVDQLWWLEGYAEKTRPQGAQR